MTPEIARAAMKFMARAQLVGEEVPAFNAVMNELDRHARSDNPSSKEAAATEEGDGKAS